MFRLAVRARAIATRTWSTDPVFPWVACDRQVVFGRRSVGRSRPRPSRPEPLSSPLDVDDDAFVPRPRRARVGFGVVRVRARARAARRAPRTPLSALAGARVALVQFARPRAWSSRAFASGLVGATAAPLLLRPRPRVAPARSARSRPASATTTLATTSAREPRWRTPRRVDRTSPSCRAARVDASSPSSIIPAPPTPSSSRRSNRVSPRRRLPAAHPPTTQKRPRLRGSTRRRGQKRRPRRRARRVATRTPLVRRRARDDDPTRAMRLPRRRQRRRRRPRRRRLERRHSDRGPLGRPSDVARGYAAHRLLSDDGLYFRTASFGRFVARGRRRGGVVSSTRRGTVGGGRVPRGYVGALPRRHPRARDA